jgi:hypothetical protein
MYVFLLCKCMMKVWRHCLHERLPAQETQTQTERESVCVCLCVVTRFYGKEIGGR